MKNFNNNSQKESTRVSGVEVKEEGLKNGMKPGFSRNKQNKKGKKSKKRGKFNKDELRPSKGSMFNDIGYYKQNPTISEAFGNLPYSTIIGGRVPNKPESLTASFSQIISFAVDWAVSACDPGNDNVDHSNILQSLLEQVKTIIYTAMRRVNAGATNAVEPLDILISNLVAGIDILCNAVYFNTFFRIANTFSWRNRMIPKEIFIHRGIDYDDFVANQATYRGRYDTLVAYAKTIRVLKQFPFINAAIAEYANIFKDEDTSTGREQIIVPVKKYHHIYDPIGTDAHPGGQVRLMQLKDVQNTSSKDTIVTSGMPDDTERSLITFDKMLNIMQKQIEALVNDADFNLIQADLEKAFGEAGNYLEVAPVYAEDKPMDIIYSGEFELMFKHGIFYTPNQLSDVAEGAGYNIEPPNLYCNTLYQKDAGSQSVTRKRLVLQLHTSFNTLDQTTNYIDEILNDDYGIHGTVGSVVGLGNFVSSNVDNPGADDNIIMSRYKNLGTSVPNNEVIPAEFRPEVSQIKVCPLTHGTNFVLFGHMISEVHYSTDAGRHESTVVRSMWHNLWTMHIVEVGQHQQNLYMAVKLQNLKCHPMIWFSVDENSQNMSILGDTNNVRFFDPTEIDNLNLSCFLSLWDIPNRTNI